MINDAYFQWIMIFYFILQAVFEKFIERFILTEILSMQSVK